MITWQIQEFFESIDKKWGWKMARTWSRKFQSRVSNALWMSNLRAQLPSKALLGSILIAYDASQIPSSMCRSRIKPNCWEDMILGAIMVRWSTKFFVIIWKLKYAKAIGEERSMKSSPWTLGMSTTKFEFTLGRS